MSDYHTPVLLDQTVAAFLPLSGKRLIDATVGGAGHTYAFLSHGAEVLGIDADTEALDESKKRLAVFPKKHWTLVHGNFRNLETIAETSGFTEVDGILADLGVSSRQIKAAEKGFSFMNPEAPLDMRFDQGAGRTAAEILNTSSEDELYEIFSTLGEEERSGAIAHAVARARTLKPLRISGDLTEAIAQVVREHDRIPVQARIFQAVRMSVNDETGSLKSLLNAAERLIRPGGILAVISFHSLEDRIVKLAIRKGPWEARTNKPLVADQTERNSNPRSRSAKLRIAIRK